MVISATGEWIVWTPEEDAQLLARTEKARNAFGRIIWADVEPLPNRTGFGMQKRLYAIKQNLTKGRGFKRPAAWSAAEQAALAEAVTGKKGVDWDAVAALLPGRSPAACYARWKHYPEGRFQPRGGRHIPREYYKPEQTASPCARLCICCREPFNSWDRKRNWMCNSCRMAA
jgi:hypothetical protein